MWRRIASVGDEALARRTLALTLGDEIPRQLRTGVVSMVAASHPRLGWDFYLANRATLDEMLDPLQRIQYAASIAGNSSDAAIADALVVYGRENPASAESAERTAASMRVRAQLADRTMPAVDAWIARHGRGRGR